MLLPSRSIVSPSVTSKTGCKEHCMLFFAEILEDLLTKRSITTALSVVFIILFSNEYDSNCKQSRLLNMLTAKVTNKNFHKKLGIHVCIS